MDRKEKKFYISTPLYYPSGKWHLGHSYTTVLCDSIARYKRMAGFETFFLTGTDEHGQKIMQSAKRENKTEKEYVDSLVEEIKKLWQKLDINYDKFIRTTDDYHIKSVQKIFNTLLEKGDIYKGKYKGKYCVPCESFWTNSQLIDDCCPDCKRNVIDFEEECYFFKLSKYEDKIKKLLTETDFLLPSFRATEMVNNFINTGLTDLAVTRTSVKWGIPVLGDEKHIIYVWIDALSNYINALGYNNGEENFSFWPCDVHMVGKEIVRFHAIIWPALLMALDLPLPRRVYGHGWLLLEGDKMSKSKGNTADPFTLINRYGIDSVRYYLLREIPFGLDGVYSDESFLNRINTDLVNDLGNLVKRTIAMANQYFKGEVNKPKSENPLDNDFILAIKSLSKRVEREIDNLSCSKALEEIFLTIKRANKYIDETTPWIKFKNKELERLNEVLYNLLECIRIASGFLFPFIPSGAERIYNMLNIDKIKNFDDLSFSKKARYDNLKDEILYLRLDVEKELKELNQSPQEEEKKEEFITIEDFDKIKLKVVKVLEAEKVEKTEKLLKLLVETDEETKQTQTVISGIAKHYEPTSLIGKKVILLSNLKPIKIRGIESKGMLLCASDESDNLSLLIPERDIKSGSGVS